MMGFREALGEAWTYTWTALAWPFAAAIDHILQRWMPDDLHDIENDDGVG